jgi:CubicO group peptidase (beta-lactamase class C family)
MALLTLIFGGTPHSLFLDFDDNREYPFLVKGRTDSELTGEIVALRIKENSFPRIRNRNVKMRICFACFLGLLILPFIACASGVKTTAPASPRVTADEVSQGFAGPDWSWKTIRGEVRNREQIQKVLKDLMEEYGVSGLSLALKQGEYYLSKQIKTNLLDMGVEDPKTGKSIDAMTVFRADRLGQPVTAYVVLKLASDEQFDLDMPLVKYIPKLLSDYPLYQDLKSDPRTKKLTARLILSHQSGLANSRLTRPDRKLVFEASPGDGFRYSEEGYQLLQIVLEEKTGRSLNDLAKTMVFSPLGMNQSSFIKERRFEGHFATGLGGGADREDPSSDLIRPFITTASDYTKFLWIVRMSGFELSHEEFMSHIIYPSITIRSSSILEPPNRGSRSALPKGLAWCLGWGFYEIPRVILNVCSFMGQRGKGIECYAMAFESEIPTALTIFVAGNENQSAMARILREILGEIETPLTWLGI